MKGFLEHKKLVHLRYIGSAICSPQAEIQAFVSVKKAIALNSMDNNIVVSLQNNL
jgi:hypothetical protein